MVTVFSGQEPHQKTKDVGNKLFQISTSETQCRKIHFQLWLLMMTKPKTYDPKGILCELIINWLQMLYSTHHSHARQTKGQQTGRWVEQLNYSQEIKGESEVDTLPSFSLTPGVFFALAVMERNEITEAIILVCAILRKARLRKSR